MPGTPASMLRPPVLTLQGARDLRPRVSLLAARIRRRLGVMERLDRQLLVLRALGRLGSIHPPDIDEYVEKSIRFHRLRGQVDALLERLAQMGCAVRDDDPRYVDFTFMRPDGLAYLCWQPGTEEIAHWHYMDEPHTSRRTFVPARSGEPALSPPPEAPRTGGA